MERRPTLPALGEGTTYPATDATDPHTQLKQLIDELDTPCASALLTVVHTWLETSAALPYATTCGVLLWLLPGG
jgi:hypothetical protein